MARDDLNDLLETANREHFEKQKVQEFYSKYMEILDGLDLDFFNTMEAEEEERKAIEDAKFRLLSVKPHSATTPTIEGVEHDILNPPKRMTPQLGIPEQPPTPIRQPRGLLHYPITEHPSVAEPS